MRSHQPLNSPDELFHPLFEPRRAAWAATVALGCGIFGAVVGLLSLTTGYDFDLRPPQDPLNIAYADELAYDFAALRPPRNGETDGAASPSVTQHTRATLSDAAPATARENRCAEGTWPYFDESCLWATAEPKRHRGRVALRLKSHWCAGPLHRQSFYSCRS